MAATVEASRLTEAHRLAQLRVAATTVARMVTLWPLLDLTDLDASFPAWLQVSLPILSVQRRVSATLAANYLAAFRTLELGVTGEASFPVLADELDIGQATTSLLVTGPVRVKANMAKGVPLERAGMIASGLSAAAGMRLALNGGRETIVETVKADRKALGWARATSGKACHFCAMLASRGPVYRGEDTGGFEAHDHCSCTVEPVYRRDAAWPTGAQQYREKWDEVAAGKTGEEARLAFRHALQGA